MKLLISALDHSANIHLKALKKKLSDDIEFIGIFDKTLGNPHIDIGALAIMGFVDALRKLPFFLKLSRKMVELAADADKVLLIDSSGFNLPLAKKNQKTLSRKRDHLLHSAPGMGVEKEAYSGAGAYHRHLGFHFAF